MDEGTGGDVAEGKGVAHFDIRIGARDDGIAYRKACGSEDVILGAVFVLDQGDERGTVGIVFKRLDLSGHIELRSLEIDDTIFLTVAAAVMADGDSAVGVSACGLLEGLKKASFGSDL